MFGRRQDRSRFGDGRNAFLRENELDRGALCLFADRHVVDDDTIGLFAGGDSLQHATVTTSGNRTIVLQLLVIVPAETIDGCQRLSVDEGGARSNRARHGDETLGFRLGKISPARRLHRSLGVVHDAGGDQLGRVVVTVGIIERSVEILGFRRLVGQELAGGLHALKRHRVGDQQNVGDRVAGGDLGVELRHDLRSSVTHPLDIDARIGGLEAVNGCLRIGIRLAGIDHQVGSVDNAGETERDKRRERGKELFHGRVPV
ncbi:hypothetical protein D3C73_470560 [compost metagenome]